MTNYTIKCTRCDGTGHFTHYGTCFKCQGNGTEVLNEKQYAKYTQYNKQKENASSYIMFNKVNGAIVKLLDSDINKARLENVSIQINGKVIPVSKVELNNNSFIAIKYSHDYVAVLTQLVKLFNDKQGVQLTDEQIEQYVNNNI